MPETDPARVQRTIRRQRRMKTIRRWLFWGILFSSTTGYAAKRWADEHQVFVVETIRLEVCPDHLRGPANATLQSLLGQTFFEVAAQREAMVQKLARLPEVRGAELTCRPPATVTVKLLPRVPTFAVQAGGQWLSVDDEAVIVRVGARPEPGLCELLGVPVPVLTPGTKLVGRRLEQAVECREACNAVVGQPPVRIGFEPGGSLRVRLATGGLVLLGQPADLERKLHSYLVVKNRLTTPVEYIDVATPTVPAWRPVSGS